MEDGAGGDAVDEDTVGDEGAGDVLGGGDEGGLGGHVAEVPAELPAVDGGDVDDAAPLLLAHVGNDEAHEGVAAEDVEVEDVLELVHGEFGGVGADIAAADVVDEDVDGAQLVDDLLVQGCGCSMSDTSATMPTASTPSA